MKRVREILRAFFYWVTRKEARHNRALRDLMFLTKAIEDFFAAYHLQEDPQFRAVFKNIGQARIDATEIAHQTSLRIERAKRIERKELSLLVEELHSDFEELKRSLYTRTLSTEVLSRRVSRVDIALENLLAALSAVELK